MALDLQMITFMLIGVLFNALYRGASRGWAIVAMTVLGILFAAEWHSGMLVAVTVPGLESYGLAFVAFGGCYIARRRIPTVRIAAWFADVSYPLYVVHGVAGYVLIRAALRVGLSPVEAVGCAFGCAVVAAWLLHVAIELPTQRIGQTLARRSGRSIGDRVGAGLEPRIAGASTSTNSGGPL